MIPKIIHYCWLSGDEFPESIKHCLDSWKEFLPDYEFRLWDTKRFDMQSCLWVRQAFEAKKYAFAADYIRLYALYYEGGIYMDSDVVVYKSFNDLLHLPYFIGEDNLHCFEPAIIGCEPGIPWIKQVLDRYDNRHFVKDDGSLDMRGLPVVFADRLSGNFHFLRTDEATPYNLESDVIRIFSSNRFNSRDYVGAIRTPYSYCSHNYLGSWMCQKSYIKNLFKRITPRPLANLYYSAVYCLDGSKSLKHIQIPFSEK